jgi:Flp pilus assembly protein TadB
MVRARLQTGGMDRDERTLLSGLGWLTVGLLGVVVLVETVVLTIVAAFISVPLAIAVPCAVAVVFVLVGRSARRARSD